ncbi:MAG: LptF/LptG family permease [Armatimonadetes bacterium]|nr:LptF/LptG family permease [Armatimonadota bacterium]MDW8121435.1 LptF/LptG family permease [Armatimonadota bacterium]
MVKTQPRGQSLVPELPRDDRWERLLWWVPFLSRMDRYFFREMILPFLTGLSFFVVVLTGHYLYQVINLIINRGLPAKEMLLILIYLIPEASALAIPIGMILCTSVVLNRLGREMELMALRACGVSVQRMVYPFLVVASFVTVGDFYLNDRIVPEANYRADNLIHKILFANPTPLLEQDKFFKVGDSFYFYVREVDRATNRLRGVLIVRRDPRRWEFPEMIAAQWAEKKPHANLWTLHDGVVHAFDRSGRTVYHTEKPFKTMTLNLDEDIEKFWSQERQITQLPTREMKERIEFFDKAGLDTYSWKIDYHFKFAIPAATLIMSLWAAPLALRYAPRGSFAGLFIAILGVFLYQGAIAWARAFGEKFRIDPFLAAWSTNIFFGIMGAWLLWRER